MNISVLHHIFLSLSAPVQNHLIINFITLWNFILHTKYKLNYALHISKLYIKHEKGTPQWLSGRQKTDSRAITALSPGNVDLVVWKPVIGPVCTQIKHYRCMKTNTVVDELGYKWKAMIGSNCL